MAKKMGLGRGLSALVAQTSEEVQVATEVPEASVVELEVSCIHRNPSQPRIYFDENDLQSLCDSIREVGILQPIIVRPDGDGYEIVAGERRYQAARRAGLERVPVVVRKINDTESLEIALIENIQRSNLNCIEEALAYRELLASTGMTQEQLSKKVSRSRSAIANSMRLLDLPEEVQALVVDGALSAGHARAILGVPSADKRTMIAHKVVEGKLSVRQTESLVALFSVEQADKSPRPVVPSSFKRAAKRLRRDLETNVKIKQVQGKYKIEIEFADEQELARLLGRFKSE